MMKKILVLISSLLVLTVGICGCRAKSGSETATQVQSESGKPILRVAMECAYPPFNWSQETDENGAVPIYGTNQYANGLDVTVAKMICEEEGYELQIIKTDWDSMILGLQSDKWDAVIAGMGITDERKKSVDFSVPYKYLNYSIILKKDSPYANATSVAELDGATAITQLGSVWEQMVPQIPNVNELAPLATTGEAVVAVDSGKADVAVFDDATCISACLSHPDLMYIAFEDGKGFAIPEGQYGQCGVAVKKGNSEILEKINDALADYTKEQQADDLYKAIDMQPLTGEQ